MENRNFNLQQGLEYINNESPITNVQIPQNAHAAKNPVFGQQMENPQPGLINITDESPLMNARFSENAYSVENPAFGQQMSNPNLQPGLINIGNESRLSNAQILEKAYTVENPVPVQQMVQHAAPPDEIPKELLNQQNEQAVREVTAANRQLGMDVLKATSEMCKTVNSLRREAAAKKTEKSIRIREEELIEIVQVYDDGTVRYLGTLSDDLFYPLNMYRLIISKEVPDTREILQIVPDCISSCFVPLEKASGKTIYDAMIRAGIVFNPQFKTAEVQKFLEKICLSKINEAEQRFFHHLSGWVIEEQRFVQGPFCPGEWIHNCSMPRDTKRLEGRELSLDSLEQYTAYLRGISDEKLRLMLWIYPFVGITNALLEQNGLSFQSVLNLVVTDSPGLQNKISFFLKTYERNKAGNRSVTEKSFERILGESKDEVLILGTADAASSYARQKQKERLKQAVQYARKELQLPEPFNRQMLGCLCLLTKVPVDGADVMHLYADENDFTGRIPRPGTQDRDVMRDVWWGYVNWIICSWERVQLVLQSFLEKYERAGNAAVFDAVFCLAESYFENLGIPCFYKKMALLSEPDFAEFFVSGSQRESVRYFVTRMRVLIQDYCIQDITEDRSCPQNMDVFFTDSECVMIESGFFDILAKRMGIEKKQKLLLQLSEEKMLISNTDRYYYRLQLSDRRFRTVKIRLELFERIGEVSIVNLGREKAEKC